MIPDCREETSLAKSLIRSITVIPAFPKKLHVHHLQEQ